MLCQNIELRGADRLKKPEWTLPDPSCTRSVRKKKESAMSLFSPVPAPERSIWKLQAHKRQLNSRVSIIISDNAKVFKATADWIKTVRRNEKLQNYLARENIRWQFNLAKSPWWGGIYVRLIKEIKKTLHKTLGRSHLSYEAFESVIMHIERNLNNRPLTYVEAEGEEEAVLTPNMIRWGDVYAVEDTESSDAEKLTSMAKRLENAKANAWKRWKREYVHSLMESHRLNKETGTIPQVGEIVLIIGDEKNRGEWRKGKVVRLIKGKDDVVRGVTLLHKRHTIDRPLQLVCPVEIRAVENVDQPQKGRRD